MPYDEKMPKAHLFWCVFPDRVDNKYQLHFTLYKKRNIPKREVFFSIGYWSI